MNTLLPQLRLPLSLILCCLLSCVYADDMQLVDDFCFSESTDRDYAEGTKIEFDGTLPTEYPFDWGYEYEFDFAFEAVNIIFMMDDSSSMYNPTYAPPGYATRWEAVKEHFSDLTQRILDEGRVVNIGMTFMQGTQGDRGEADWATNRAYHGAHVGFPVQPLTVASRTALMDMLEKNNNNKISDGTPFGDLFYETALYMRGETVHLGRDRLGQKFESVSHPDSYVDGTPDIPGCHFNFTGGCKNEKITDTPLATYVSPIQFDNQPTYLILFTDGDATALSTESELKSLMGTTTCTPAPNESGLGGREPYHKCLYEMAKWLSTADHVPSVSGERVVLHTLFYGTHGAKGKYLKDLADVTGGQGVMAADHTELEIELGELVFDYTLDIESISSPTPGDSGYSIKGEPTDIINTISGRLDAEPNDMKSLYSMSALSISTDTDKVTRHSQEAYITVFKPNIGAAWQGNLKKYKVSGSPQQLVDKNNNVAFIPATGFVPTSVSVWSSGADGDDAAKGGAAGVLKAHGSRALYTDISNTAAITDDPIDHADTIKSSANALIDGNVTKTHLGYPSELSDDQVTEIIKWVRGETPGQENFIGDAIHSSPVVVTYDIRSGSEEKVVYFVTNQGFLHAINSETGEEKWAYMPEELLTNLPTLSRVHFDAALMEYKFGYTSFDTVYGLDKTPELWVQNVAPLNHINSSHSAGGVNDKVMLYLSMRRGGKNIYALDVTDPNNPKLAWKILGGPGGTPGFEKLYQTWSQPQKGRIDVNGTEMDVLFFGGGFYPRQDIVDKSNSGNNDWAGNRLFMVDANTGELLWVAGQGGPWGATRHKTALGSMRHSIPSDVTLFDANDDGLTDMLFVGDLGGQIWRVDITNGEDWGPQLIDAGRIAHFQVAGDKTHFRRFFHPPDVLLLKDPQKDLEPKLAISIGSGARIDPHDVKVRNAFFMIYSSDVYEKPASYGTPLNKVHLVDVTTPSMVPDTAKGWYLEFPNPGEKVITKSTTILGTTTFTTYIPPRTTTIGGWTSPDCNFPGQTHRWYVSLLDGSGVLDLDANGTVDQSERYQFLTNAHIMPEGGANLVFTEDGVDLFEGPRNITPMGIIGEVKPWQRSGWVEP